MPYSKQTWQTGDVVTSAKLNHMEDGIAGGGGYKVTVSFTPPNTVVSDKTSNEILNAAVDGSVPYAVLMVNGSVNGILPLVGIMHGQAMFGYEVVESTGVAQMLVTIDSNGGATMDENFYPE